MREEGSVRSLHRDSALRQGEWAKREEGTRPRGPFFFFQAALHRCFGGGGNGTRGIVAHMPEKRERHDKLDLMTVAKKRDMKVGRAGRTDRN